MTVSEILQAKYSRNEVRVEELLKSGITLSIFEAAATGQTARVRELLSADPALVNAYAPDGFFPLALAVFFGNKATAEMLLDAGADVNQQSREAMKIRSLQSAVAARRLDLAEMLLARGANPDARGEGGFTALHGVAVSGQVDLARLLVKHGADVNAKDDAGKTSLSLATSGQKAEMAVFLREHGGT
ncbi:MAG TPA: ankyrin repeat domain-containing protein [Vicinamibacterales bacterium]|nr:ankyrin repeat domain-containing protein [Vicinamibacterales bacterium]